MNRIEREQIFAKYKHLGVPQEVQVKTAGLSIYQDGGHVPVPEYITRPVKVLPKKYIQESYEQES
jgi:hypothetical protein